MGTFRSSDPRDFGAVATHGSETFWKQRPRAVALASLRRILAQVPKLCWCHSGWEAVITTTFERVQEQHLRPQNVYLWHENYFRWILRKELKTREAFIFTSLNCVKELEWREVPEESRYRRWLPFHSPEMALQARPVLLYHTFALPSSLGVVSLLVPHSLEPPPLPAAPLLSRVRL